MKPLRPVRPRMPAEIPAMDASDVRQKSIMLLLAMMEKGLKASSFPGTCSPSAILKFLKCQQLCSWAQKIACHQSFSERSENTLAGTNITPLSDWKIAFSLFLAIRYHQRTIYRPLYYILPRVLILEVKVRVEFN